MKVAEKSGLSYLCCEACKSIWIREPEFLSLMEEVRPGRDNTLLVHNDGTERRRCPTCSETMDIAWMLFLQMDRCEEHGIWFDPGEFNQALAGDVGSEVLDQVKTQVQRRQKEEEQRRRERMPGQRPQWLSRLCDFLG